MKKTTSEQEARRERLEKIQYGMLVCLTPLVMTVIFWIAGCR